jgi:hypothetical protein
MTPVASNIKRQSGYSIFTIIFWLLLLTITLTCVLKMGPVYMENLSFKSIMSDLPEQFPAGSYVAKKDIRVKLARRMQIDMIDGLTANDVEISREDENYVVTANYEVRTPLIANVAVVMSFNEQSIVPVKPE